MITVYSLIGDTPRPWLTFSGFPDGSSITDIATLSQLEAMGEVFLLSAAHEGFTALSTLWAIPMADGRAELVFLVRDGQKLQRNTNTELHLITALTENAKAYADAIGVTGFYLRTSTRSVAFLRGRFKEWTVESGKGGVSEAWLDV